MVKGFGFLMRTTLTATLLVAWVGFAIAQSPKPDSKVEVRPETKPLPAGPTLLIDPFSGEVLSEYRAGEPWYPASLTKLMTAYVIFKKIQDGAMKLDQQIPISELAHSQPASRIGIPIGKTVSVDFALQALLVHSANDMAYVLAEAASGSVDGFARDMNAIAKGMGLQATHFVNPNGLYDPRHISSARDMGVIAALIINQYPEHLHYFKQDAVPVGRKRLPNHNSLIRIMPEAVGMKTGFICNSGYNLVGSAIRGGRQLVSVVLGAHSGGTRAKLSKDMLDEGFANLGKPGHGRVSEIPDQAYGAIVPVDLTTTVCKRKQAISPVNAHRLSGWGISFGTFDTGQKADMALRGRLISPVGIDAGGIGGIVELPNKAGFNAMLWNLDQPKSLELCTQYKAEGAICDVMPDALLLQMAAAAPPDDEAIDEEEGDALDPKIQAALDAKAAAEKAKVKKP